MKIKLSDSLALPIESITNTFAVFGIRGSGKSNIGAVMAEGIIKAGQPVCIIDPTGAWYGLKSSADGKSPGLPVYVFGGEHADIPLEPTAGEVLANFVVERRVPVVLDLKLMRKHEQIRFVMMFAETLFHRNREPLMVIIDETARFAPQIIKDKSPDAPRCLGAIEDLATLGRSRGVGVTLLAQRPAPVSTTLRTQIENLICLRTIGKHDRKALDEWVEAKGSQQERDQMMKDLADLPDGMGYFWSPGWLHKFIKTQFYRRETYDSGRTPKVGERVVAPRAFAEVDKAQLSAEIQATIERAKADDPAELRKQIADLKKQVGKTAAPAQAVEVKRVEVPILKDGHLDRIEALVQKFQHWNDSQFAAAKERFEAMQTVFRDLTAVLKPLRLPPPVQNPSLRQTQTNNFVAHPPTRPQPIHRESAAPSGNGALPRGEAAALTAACQYPYGVTRQQISILTGYKRSSRDAYIQRLKERGLIETNGDLVLATSGAEQSLGGNFQPLPTGEALRDYWRAKLPDGERKVLEVLIDADGAYVPRELIDERTNYRRSSRDAYIQRLKARKLVVIGPGGVVAASGLLFE